MGNILRKILTILVVEMRRLRLECALNCENRVQIGICPGSGSAVLNIVCYANVYIVIADTESVLTHFMRWGFLLAIGNYIRVHKVRPWERSHSVWSLHLRIGDI